MNSIQRSTRRTRALPMSVCRRISPRIQIHNGDPQTVKSADRMRLAIFEAIISGGGLLRVPSSTSPLVDVFDLSLSLSRPRFVKRSSIGRCVRARASRVCGVRNRGTVLGVVLANYVTYMCCGSATVQGSGLRTRPARAPDAGPADHVCVSQQKTQSTVVRSRITCAPSPARRIWKQRAEPARDGDDSRRHCEEEMIYEDARPTVFVIWGLCRATA